MSPEGPTFYADLGNEVILPDRGIHSQTLSKENDARTPVAMALYLLPLAPG